MQEDPEVSYFRILEFFTPFFTLFDSKTHS